MGKLDIDFVEPETRNKFGVLFGAFRSISNLAQIRHLFGIRFGKVRKVGIEEKLIERNLFHIGFKPLKMGPDQNFQEHFGTMQ